MKQEPRPTVGSSSWITAALVVVALFAASATPAASRTEAAALGGRIAVERGDPDAFLPGVVVELTPAAGGAVHRATSGPLGAYAFVGLEPGPYVVTVDCPGFEPYRRDVSVPAGGRVELDIGLTLRYAQAVTVTATRSERVTNEVPAAVSVVGHEELETTPMTNIKDALEGIPGTLVSTKNEGYDSRLIIRGAGLKARYGIREIMMLLNGIPITDPDSFTRLDFVNPRLIDRVEVVRGPNSTVWGINATGGTVNVITKNPVEAQGGAASVDAGSFGTSAGQVGYSLALSDRNFVSFDLSRRMSDNSWRPHNRFSTTQVTAQPWFSFANGSMLETYITYTDAALQLPGGLVVDKAKGTDQWTPFLEDGTVLETADPWRDMARNSKVLFSAVRLRTAVGGFQAEPVVFANVWSHFHPVTGKINEADTTVAGIDVPFIRDQGWGSLTVGFTARYDGQRGTAFTYADVRTAGNGRVLATLSDREGARMEKLDRITNLYGAYVQQSLKLGSRVLVDLGVRYDRIHFTTQGDEWLTFNWSTGRWVPGAGAIDSARTYSALSPRIGAVLRVTPDLNVYGNVSTGVQTPTSDELTTNPALDLTTVVNYEIGAKGTFAGLTFDSSLYRCRVRDEVVQVAQGYGASEYVNAGSTRKVGLELSLAASPWRGVEVGGAYSYSDFVFEEFTEPLGTKNLDRSGNRLPLIPRHQSSLFAGYRHTSGLMARATVSNWGTYFLDNANSETYRGYSMVTDLTLGYQGPRYEAMVMVQNLFDDRYSVEVQKDLSGVRRYTPAAPRAIRLRVGARF